MITYKNSHFYLETKHTSYIMRVLANGILQHTYYGKKILQDDLTYYRLRQERAFSSMIEENGEVIFREQIPQEYPTFGRGDYRKAAVLVEGEDGRCVNDLRYAGYEILAQKPHIPGMPQLDVNTEDTETLAITLRDEITGFDVILYYSVFEEEDMISRFVEIRNQSEQTLQIRNAASLSVDFERADFEFISLKGAWGRERHVSRRKIEQGTTSIESRRGSSSHQLNPFAALVGRNTDEQQGEVYGFSLIYSADFKALAEVDQFDNTRMQIGLNQETFSWKLCPGERFMTPEALMTYTADGLNRMSQNFHQICRNHLGRSADRSIVHPIIINSWEAMYFDMSEEKIKRLIAECKGLGIDTFVLDDGWFGHRSDDHSSLGDWFVNEKNFGRIEENIQGTTDQNGRNGLHRVVDFCHENGMKFGIWFEPEMISRDSELYRQHPDWCIHCENAAPIESRWQMVLDMSRSEVVDHIYAQMAKVIEEYQISYIKWDFNRNLTDNGSAALPADQQKEHTHRYMLGVYSLMQRLIESYPEVFYEGCSGGGGRFDFGILYYMPQIWTSDDSDAVERMKIQYGTSFVYPPASMVAHVSACPNHQTGRTTPFDTRGEVAQMCSYGYEFDIGKLSLEEKEKIKLQTRRHRKLESLVQNGRFYRLKSPFEGNVCAWELVSEEQDKAYVCVGFLTTAANAASFYLKLDGLDEQRQYHVEQMGITVSGAALMHAGIPVIMPENTDYACLAFDITEK